MQLASDKEEDLYTTTNAFARVPRAGFETIIPLGHTNGKYLRAAALDTNQQVIGSTGVCDTLSGKVTEVNTPISAAKSSDNMGTKPSGKSFEAFHTSPRASYSWPVLVFWFAMGVLLWFVDSLSCLLLLVLFFCTDKSMSRYRRKDVYAAYRHVLHGRSRSVTGDGVSPLE